MRGQTITEAGDFDYSAELARMKRTRFNAPDDELLAMARDALDEYIAQVSEPTPDDPEALTAAERAQRLRALQPLETVFVEWRQYLRRRKIAKAAHVLASLLSPTLDAAHTNELGLLARKCEHDGRAIGLSTFVTRHVMGALRTAEGNRLLDLRSANLHAAGIVTVLLQRPIPDATASSRVTHALKITRQYRP